MKYNFTKLLFFKVPKILDSLAKITRFEENQQLDHVQLIPKYFSSVKYETPTHQPDSTPAGPNNEMEKRFVDICMYIFNCVGSNLL